MELDTAAALPAPDRLAGSPVRAVTGPRSAADSAHGIGPFETVVNRAERDHVPMASGNCEFGRADCADAADRRRASRRSFEAFAMQTFIDAMLPDETVKLFGTGSAGKMWKSMLAEQLAGQITASGRLRLVPDTASQVPPRRLTGAATGPPVQDGKSSKEVGHRSRAEIR